MRQTLRQPVQGERGSALFIAIIGMLILGVMSLSFVALGNLEMRIGVNHREALDALNLAESAIEHARDIVKSAGVANYTTWVNSVANGSLLVSNFSAPGGGVYSARIDNDCSTTVTGPNITFDSNCATHSDGNDRAVLTSWATKGTGRARVRVWIQVSNAWKHVCYDGDSDGNGSYCTGNGDYFPDDPLDPNGPATGVIPTPDPSFIKCGGDVRTPVGITLLSTDCVFQPYYDLAAASNPTTACTGCPGGATPATLGAACNQSAPFVAGAMNGTCGTGGGLVYWGVTGNWTHGAGQIDFQSMCVGDHNASTFAGLNPPHPDPAGAGADHNGCPGATTSAHTVYVMGRVKLKNGSEINGTLVIHGDGVAGNDDFDFAGQSSIHTIPGCNTAQNGNPGCGYPLALMVYDPSQGAPPQNTETHASNSNTNINGIVYTAGTLNFQATDTVYGGGIASGVNFQASSADVFYVAAFGNAAPPPGFPPLGQAAATVMRSTYAQCRYYADQTSPTDCNE